MIAETRGPGGGRAPRGPGDAPAPLPLVRLRVDYTGFTTINSQRFGQKFVNKVRAGLGLAALEAWCGS
jgi:double-strand break repair protein MRE11